MPVVEPAKLAQLQGKPDNVRNICILAHVDHGKTTLSDFLLTTNGIVQPSQAGQARYLDNRPDEQERGITMKSSAISLYFSMMRRKLEDMSELEPMEYLINLIDSPGHIDFSSEVSTASRLCDGAIVLVDAVEGVCSQTVTVLRQTWVEKLKPLLVVNKIDRLITELQLSPSEAYIRLSQIVEEVNAVLGSFFQGERMEQDLNWRERMEARVAAAVAKEAAAAADREVADLEFIERDDEEIYFAPEKENVIFCSAIDGWAFTVRQFSHLYEKKLGMKKEILNKVLWGNFYLDPKTKKVIGPKHLRGRDLKPIFVQLVLEQVWAVYRATTGIGTEKGNAELLEKITKSLNINLLPKVARSTEPVRKLRAVFEAWLPLSTALLVSVAEHIPSPKTAQPQRLPSLLDSLPSSSYIDPQVRNAMNEFKSTKNDPVVVYVSKMVSVSVDSLPENRRVIEPGNKETALEKSRKLREERKKMEAINNPADQQNSLANFLANATLEDVRTSSKEEKTKPERLIGFARIYSGVLSVGDEVFVLGPKFNPAHPHDQPNPQKVKVTALYMLMGAELEILQSVPAGVVFGIGGLEGYVLKAATLCSQVEGAVNLAGIGMAGAPIFRVSLTPRSPLDLDKMITGLKLLVQSDPCAEYEHLSTGEHVLATAGELHLERCLLDLRERFAHCEIQASEPIVPFRETIVHAEEMRPAANKELGRGTAVMTTPSGIVTVKLCVRPLPTDMTDFLVKNPGSLRRLYAEQSAKDNTSEKFQVETAENGDDERIISPDELRKKLAEKFNKGNRNKEIWRGSVDDVVAFGPKRIGPNLLIDITKDKLFSRAFSAAEDGGIEKDEEEGSDIRASDFMEKIIYAFQLCTQSGPLCNEPVQGTALFIEEVTINPYKPEEKPEQWRLTSEVITAVQSAYKSGFLDWSPRMMLASYAVEIQAPSEVIGRVYDVLTRRRGRVLSESMKEGTPFFTIQALLPVAESFGFSTEMRKKTSGAAQPQLIFAGFEILEEDPFWVPFTEDDLEDLGELADKENVAKKYMDKVRKKKGLLVEGRNVKRNAEKQKTLKK